MNQHWGGLNLASVSTSVTSIVFVDLSYPPRRARTVGVGNKSTLWRVQWQQVRTSQLQHGKIDTENCSHYTASERRRAAAYRKGQQLTCVSKVPPAPKCSCIASEKYWMAFNITLQNKRKNRYHNPMCTQTAPKHSADQSSRPFQLFPAVAKRDLLHNKGATSYITRILAVDIRIYHLI